MKKTIAFCGDSYCAGLQNQKLVSWPDLIALELNFKIVSRGVKGTPFYSAYEQVNRAIDLDIDCIIICITHYARLANLYDLSVMPNSPPTRTFDALVNKVGSEKKAKEINLACELYYEHLYKDEYHATVHQLLIESLDRRLLEHKKKVIWFHCDENSLHIPIKSGPCLNDSLYNISISELNEDDTALAIAVKTDDLRAAEIALKRSETPDKRLNHLNNENNRILAGLVLDVIKNDSFTARLIRKQDYFL